MGLITAVNNSSAMTAHKYKQAFICEQQSRCTSFHSGTHLTSKYYSASFHRHKTTHTHTCTAICNPQTHNCVYRGRMHTENVAPCRQERDVQSQISANVYQHIREEPKQPADTRWLKISWQRRDKHYQMCVCKVKLEFRIILASSMLKQQRLWQPNELTASVSFLAGLFLNTCLRSAKNARRRNNKGVSTHHWNLLIISVKLWLISVLQKYVTSLRGTHRKCSLLFQRQHLELHEATFLRRKWNKLINALNIHLKKGNYLKHVLLF